MQKFAFNNWNFYPVRIDSNILSLNLLETINFNIFCSVWLEDLVELSIFDFVDVHNRKIPRGLTETHEADLYLSGL